MATHRNLWKIVYIIYSTTIFNKNEDNIQCLRLELIMHLNNLILGFLTQQDQGSHLQFFIDSRATN